MGLSFVGIIVFVVQEIPYMVMPLIKLQSNPIMDMHNEAAWITGLQTAVGILTMLMLMLTVRDCEEISVDIIRIIKEDIKIKQHLARVDRYDTNERRALNFGHTFAHALKTFCAANKHPLTHGTAVAWGMVCELYLSVLQFGFPKDELSRLHYFVKDNYKHIPLSCSDFDKIYGFMTRDKKNISAKPCLEAREMVWC